VLGASFSKKTSYEKLCLILCLFVLFFWQKVDVLRYTDEEYEKYLIDPVGISCTLFLDCSITFISMTCLHFLCYYQLKSWKDLI
jgi:hypothetical protein